MGSLEGKTPAQALKHLNSSWPATCRRHLTGACWGLGCLLHGARSCNFPEPPWGCGGTDEKEEQERAGAPAEAL